MFDSDAVEAALRAIDEGASIREAAALVGASKSAVGRWAAGRVPHERASGRIRVRAEIGGGDGVGRRRRGPRTTRRWRRTPCSRRCWTT